MTKLHHEVHIDAPVSAVWNVLADLEAVQYYNPLVAKATCTSENRQGVGAARHCDFKPSGFSKEQVFEFQEGKALGIEVVNSSWPVTYCRWRTVLTPDGQGTLVSQDLEYAPKFGVLGKIMDAVAMRRKFNGILNDIFAGLKKYVESNARGSSSYDK